MPPNPKLVKLAEETREKMTEAIDIWRENPTNADAASGPDRILLAAFAERDRQIADFIEGAVPVLENAPMTNPIFREPMQATLRAMAFQIRYTADRFSPKEGT